MKFVFSDKESRYLFIASLIILFGISFYIFYIQVFYYRFYNIPKTDLSDHIKLIELILQHKYHVPHAGFHYSTYFLSSFTHLSREYSAIILLSLFVLISFIITFCTLRFFLRSIYPEKFLILITIFLHLVTPVFLPILNTTIYFGQGSPNFWYSPTFVMAKPFVLTIILLVIPILDDFKERTPFWNIALAGILLMISAFIKPNFALIFIPALGVYVLIKYFKEFGKYLKSFLIILPAVLLLLYQFFSTYINTDNKILGTGDQIIFSFFGAWSVHTPCLPLSVFRTLIFPLSIIIYRRREIQNNNYLIFSWILYIIAFMEFSLLAEKKSFYAQNFVNGYNFSLIPLYTFSAIELLKWIKDTNFSFNIYGVRYSGLSTDHKKIFVSTILFYLYVVSGIIYLVRQLLGYGYS